VEDDKVGDERSVSPLIKSGGIALSDSEKAEALADNLVTQFQPVTDPSVSAIIEPVNVGLGSYFMAPTCEPMLTKPEEAQEAIWGLRFGKAPGPNGIPNRALKHLQSLRYPSWSLFLTLSSSPITSLQRGSTLE
jgi:hypothetical protein